MNVQVIRKLKRYWWIAPEAVLFLIGVWLLSGDRTATPVVRLPDGTEFKLGRVAFTNTYNYSQMRGSAWMLRYSKLIPDFIENRFLTHLPQFGEP